MGEFDIKPAVRQGLRARIGLYGVAGGGKTMTALLLAEGIAPGQQIIGIDSEKQRMLEYAGMFAFGHMDLRPPYSPERYVQAIDAAARAAGPEGVVIVDSASHEWFGKGGARAIKDEAARTGSGRVKKGDDFAAWGVVTPAHEAFMQAIMLCPSHIIVTMRAKMAYEREEHDDEYGRKKTRIRKVGLEPIQRAGFEFEFSVLGIIDESHTLTVVKAAETLGVRDESFLKPGREFGERIRLWLNSGAAPRTLAPAPPPVVAEAPRPVAVVPQPAHATPTPTPVPAPPAAAQAPQRPQAGHQAPAPPPAGPKPVASAKSEKVYTYEQQLSFIAQLLGALGCRTSAEKHEYLSALLGRDIASLKDIAEDEADGVRQELYRRVNTPRRTEAAL